MVKNCQWPKHSIFRIEDCGHINLIEKKKKIHTFFVFVLIHGIEYFLLCWLVCCYIIKSVLKDFGNTNLIEKIIHSYLRSHATVCILQFLKVTYLTFQDLGGINMSMERQKAILQELMTVVKDMLKNAEVAVRSYMMLRPRFLQQNKAAAASATTPSQTSGATVGLTSSNPPPTNSMMPVFDFYSGIPKKPSPFLQQTIARFEKFLSDCRQWIEDLEQLIILDSDKNSFNSSSSLLQSLPKVMKNVHDFFVHVAAKVIFPSLGCKL